MIALYLGSRTLVFGRTGVTVHRHTRGTLNPRQAVFGVKRFKRSP